MESLVRDHYAANDLIRKIDDALTRAGKDPEKTGLRDLAPVDQLHTGGAPATLTFLEKTDLPDSARILDAGCGLGGSTRLLAKQKDWQARGIDLSPSFIEAAGILTRRTGLENRARFRTGSILDLPWEDASFDAVLCQHILMNIDDKTQAIREFFRVLRPGGRLLLHEIAQGKNPDLALPVPWAASEDISFLEPWETLEQILAETGFSTVHYTDATADAIAFWQRVSAAGKKQDGPPRPLGPHLVFGKNARSFPVTMPRNFETDAIRLIEAVVEKAVR